MQKLTIVAVLALTVGLAAGAAADTIERIAFERWRFDDVLMENADVWIVGVDGSAPRLLAEGFRPAWSPDGSRIAVMRLFPPWYDPFTYLVVVNVADGTETVLTPQLSSDRDPAWSPDGSKIALTNFYSLYVINADGSGLTPLIDIASMGPKFFFEVSSPTWSPDGTRIAFGCAAHIEFTGSQWIDEYYICQINADGSGFRQLTTASTVLDDPSLHPATWLAEPAWSPDGGRMTVTAGFCCYRDVFVINADGTGLARLTQGLDARAPTWSPDGTRIAFEGGPCGGIWVMNADGSNLRCVIGDAGSPSWAVTASVPPAPTLTLRYDGKLRDRVGMSDTALGADGTFDGTLTLTLHAVGGRTITALRLDNGVGGVWDTAAPNPSWLLGVAGSLDGPMLNNVTTMAVNAVVADAGSLVLFGSDYGGGLGFANGRTLTVTATFSDGSSAQATTTVAGGGPTLTLRYDGKLRDRVGMSDTALGADGTFDGTLTLTLHAVGGRTITALRLDNGVGGVWDTAAPNPSWLLGVAGSLDGPMLNNVTTMAVNAVVADGGSLVLFGSDYSGGLGFQPGRTLTLTATFSDGTSAQVTTVIGAGGATLTLSYDGKLRDRVGTSDTALAGDGALDGTLTLTLHAAGGRTITALRMENGTGGVWDTTAPNPYWLLGVAGVLDGAILNDVTTMGVNVVVPDGGSLVLFGSDYGAGFASGRTLTVTATFSDGTSAVGAVVIP